MDDRLALCHGDSLEVLKTFASGVFRCCVTSPPYWGLRDYGVEGQLGLEPTPEAYIERLVEIFREVRRTLADDGTLWVNIGDTHARNPGKDGANDPANAGKQAYVGGGRVRRHLTIGSSDGGVGRNDRPGTRSGAGMKPKDLVGVPWMLAFALRADGWYLRQDIIWAKKNCLPESVEDRFTKSHEYLFLLSKSPIYHFDFEAVKEPAIGDHRRNGTPNGALQYPGQSRQNGISKRRTEGYTPPSWRGSSFDKGKTAEHQLGRAQVRKNEFSPDARLRGFQDRWDAGETDGIEMRRKRDVWSIAVAKYKGAHFAVMPEELVDPCVLAGSAPGDVVLDPFCGSGTVGVVALRHGRSFVGVDLNPEYLTLAHQRITAKDQEKQCPTA